MVESAAGSTGRIFISYRREETAYPAGWLFDRLEEKCGAGQIFKDVDSIELGDDFVEVITRAVGSCDVLLAVIGDRWLTVTDKQGRRRLDDRNDFVRLEIEAALKRKVRIIPILVDGASMPHADELPAAIAGLARRQALELSPSRFEYDTSRLLKVLDKTLAEVRTAQDDAAAISMSSANSTDQRIDEQQSRQQPEQTKQRSALSVPPTAAATPAADRPTPDQTEPPDSASKRSSRWARIFVLVFGGVVVVILIVFLSIRSRRKPEQTLPRPPRRLDGWFSRMTSPVVRTVGTMPAARVRGATTRMAHTVSTPNRPERVPPREVHRGTLVACTRQLHPASESRSTRKHLPYLRAPRMGLAVGWPRTVV